MKKQCAESRIEATGKRLRNIAALYTQTWGDQEQVKNLLRRN